VFTGKMDMANLLTWLLNRRRAGGLLAVGLFFVSLAACGQNLFLTPTAPADSGFNVAPPFEAFYQDNGGLRIFGHPFSEPYTDPISGRLVQYFQNMRLEYDGATDQVTVSPLGEWLLPDETQRVEVALPGGGLTQYFGDSPYPVQDEFLLFYLQYGGPELFGLPISPQLDEGGTRVQYFRNARLEWRPEAPRDLHVQLGSLGEAHYWAAGFIPDINRAAPVDSAAIRQANIRAAFKAPILYAGEQQTIFVTLTAADGLRPVGDVAVTLLITYNDGLTEAVRLPNTDSSGQTSGLLPATFQNVVEPGQKVQVQVTAVSPAGLEIGSIISSFKTWW
jgi:hypothetical protein